MADKEKGSGAVAWGVRAVVVVGLAIAAWVIVPPYLQAQKAQPVWDEALAAYNQKEYGKAIERLEEAKALAPDWKELQQKFPVEAAKFYLAKGLQHKEAGEYKFAVQALKKTIEYDAALAAKHGAYMAVAECYHRAEKLQKALEYAKLEVDHNGRDAKIAKGMVKLLTKKITGGN